MKTILTITLITIFQMSFGQEAGIDSLQSHMGAVVDSTLHINPPSDSLPGLNTGQADSLRLALQTELDSLGALDLDVNTDSSKLMSKLDSLQSIDPTTKLDNLQEKVKEKINDRAEAVTGKVSSSTDQLNNKVSQGVGKTNEMEAPLGQGSANLPDTSLPAGELPVTDVGGVSSGLEQVDLDTDVDIPGAAIDNPLDEVSNPLEGVKQELPSKEDINVPGVEEVGEVKDKIGEVGEMSDQVSGYDEELEKVKGGDYSSVESEIEEHAADIGEVGELQKGAGEFNALQQQKAGYEKQMEALKDQEAAKEMIKSRAKQLAVNHFAKHGDKLKAAQETMAKYKRKYRSLNSIKDLPKHRTNPMKDLPLIERFSPGFGLEVYTTDVTHIDSWGSLSYKLTDRWRLWGSYLYRFRAKDDEFLFNTHTYGPRASVSYIVLRDYYLKLTFDQLRTDVPRSGTHGEQSRRWVYGGYIGLGKTYTFSGRVKGNIQAMYNFLHNDNSPYPKKLHVRFGFEFELRKRVKKKEQI